MTTSFHRPFALLVVAVACIAPGRSFALHRCTSSDGKVTYTEFQCDTGAKASGVEIHDSAGMDINKRTNNFSHSSSSKKGTSGASSAVPQKASVAESEAARKNRCRQAQSNNRVLNTPRPVYTINEKGKKGGYLDDTQRDAAIQQQGKEIADNCP